MSPADLGLSVSATPDPAAAGHNLTYTIIVSNAGPADSTNTTVVDVLPLGVTFVSATPTQGNVTFAAGKVTANLGTITSGASVPLTIVITPSTSSQIVNTASVTSDQVDVDPANNTVQTTTNVSPADLGVGVGILPSTVLAGNPVTFTVFATNNGPNVATNSVVANLLPTGFTLVSATATQGTVLTGGSGVAVQLGSLAPGARPR